MDSRRMCPHCRAFITTRDRVCPYCNETVGPRAVDRRRRAAFLDNFIPHARFLTVLILLVNFGLYLATVVYSLKAGNSAAVFGIDNRTLVLFGAKDRGFILHFGQWWRLVTAGFLHGGLLHIMMNSWVMFDLGAQVEEIYGSARLMFLYFVSTVVGFVASVWWSPSISIGASAGVFGLIGAMIALGVRYRGSMAGSLRGLYIRWAVYGLLFELLPGHQVDNAAHLGGLAGGFGAAYLTGVAGPLRSLRERLWKTAAIACAVVTALCFLKMYFWFVQVTTLLPKIH